MSTTITNAFVRQYESEVHHVYQKQGSILRPSVRVKDGVVGSSTTFQKIGTGVATTKARHGTITPMNQTHTAIEVSLSDFYAGDWVDKLDEAKINIDERMALAQGGAWALGRKVDSQIITALDATTQTTITVTVTSGAAIRNGFLSVVEALDTNDVPNDGQRYGILTPMAWSFAMTFEEFASADYVTAAGGNFMEGAPVDRWKDWLGVKWHVHTGLSGQGTSTADCFAYHKNSLGYATGAHAGNIASNQAVAADITWHGDRAAHFVNHAMSGGAGLIDDGGCIQFTFDETASLPTS